MAGMILLVDDDETFLAAMRRPLDAAGYTVLQATDGAEALKTINRMRSRLSLVVIDLALPSMSGFEVLGALTRRKTSIKTIVLTGVLKDLYLDLARNMGADLAIRKPEPGAPFSEAEWLAAVQSLLSPG